MEKDSALKYEKLQKRLKEMGRLVVSFSGGVDSTFLLAVAREVIGDQVTAVTAAGRSVPEWEIEEARVFCRERGIRHIVFSFDELEVDGFADNPPDRCYHCKTAILQKVREAAEQVDTVYIAEGSNVDDDGDYRPGKRVSELAEDILAEARQHGYGVIVESTTNNRARELESIASMGTHSADGLILSPLMMTVDDIAALDGDYPLVLLGERLFGVNAPHVVIRNREGAAAATYHLLDAGCRRIAVVGAVPHPEHDFSSGSIRTHGYREALAARDIPCDDSLLIETQGWGSADGLAAVDTMLESGLQFDAVFALNDLLAWGVLRELRERGVAVPDDVRVIGFDDVEESAYMVPSLSTVNPGREAIARLAVESIIQQVESGSRAPAQTIEAPYSLSLRESSPALACA